MLQLELRPGVSLGPISLHAPLNPTLSLLLRLCSISSPSPLSTTTALGSGSGGGGGGGGGGGSALEFVYEPSAPLEHPYVLHAPGDGLVVHVDPRSQRTTRIDVTNPAKQRLLYAGRFLATPLTLASLYAALGPTYPGSFSSSSSSSSSSSAASAATATCASYVLEWPGLQVVFEVPSQYAGSFRGDLELPDGTTPRAVSLAILPRPDDLGALPYLSTAPLWSLRLFVGIAGVAQFGWGMQQVVEPQCMGPPDDVLLKGFDKLQIHARGAPVFSHDLVCNYYSRGLDLVFSSSGAGSGGYVLRKIIAHANLPMHTAFHRYHKCPFEVLWAHGVVIPGDASWAKVQTLLSDTEPHGERDREKDRGREREADIGGRPLVHGTTSARNPFGETRFYAFDGIVFEVMRNGLVASVCITAPLPY
eukprot:ANDGO_00541.mRNA.1 UPF0183 protein At3g51130